MIFLSKKSILSFLFIFVLFSFVNTSNAHAARAGFPGGMPFNNADVKGVLKIGDTVQATSTSKINLYELPIEGPSIVAFDLTYMPSAVGVGLGVMGLDGTNLKVIQNFVRNTNECGAGVDASCSVGNSGIYQNRKSESRFFFDRSKMKDVIKVKRSPNDRFTKSYLTIYNSTPDKSLQYTLKLKDTLCVENATSFDGSKECIDGKWVNKSTDGNVRASAVKDFAPTITKDQSIVDTVDASRKSVFFKFAGEKNKLITFKVNLLDTSSCKTLPFIVSSETGGTLKGKGNTDCSFTFTTNLKEKAFLQFRNYKQDSIKFKVTFWNDASGATNTVSTLENQENLSSNTTVFSTSTRSEYRLNISRSAGGEVALQRTVGTTRTTFRQASRSWSKLITANETVTLIATPNKDAKFIGWIGDCSGTELTCTVQMSSNKKAGAKFESTATSATTSTRSEYRLNISRSAGGEVALQRTVGTTRTTFRQASRSWSKLITANETVTLIATPNKDAKFIGWIGDCSGTELTCTVQMSSNKKAGAKFGLINAPTQIAPSATESSDTSIFSTTDLELGMAHSDVIALQKFLNSNGYAIESVEGQPGSIGYESNYFGEKTKQALIKYQKDKGISPAQGYFGAMTRGVMGI